MLFSGVITSGGWSEEDGRPRLALRIRNMEGFTVCRGFREGVFGIGRDFFLSFWPAALRFMGFLLLTRRLVTVHAFGCAGRMLMGFERVNFLGFIRVGGTFGVWCLFSRRGGLVHPTQGGGVI